MTRTTRKQLEALLDDYCRLSDRERGPEYGEGTEGCLYLTYARHYGGYALCERVGTSGEKVLNPGAWGLSSERMSAREMKEFLLGMIREEVS